MIGSRRKSGQGKIALKIYNFFILKFKRRQIWRSTCTRSILFGPRSDFVWNLFFKIRFETDLKKFKSQRTRQAYTAKLP